MKIPLEEKKTPLELLSIAPYFFYLPLKITKLFIFRRRQHFPPSDFLLVWKTLLTFFYFFFLRKIKILNNGEHSLFGWNGRRLAGRRGCGRESMCSQFFRDASREKLHARKKCGESTSRSDRQILCACPEETNLKTKQTLFYTFSMMMTLNFIKWKWMKNTKKNLSNKKKIIIIKS